MYADLSKHEPFLRSTRQKRWNGDIPRLCRLGGAALLCLCCSLPGWSAPERPAAKPLTLAEQALTRIAQGDFRGAAKQTREALETAPDDAVLHTLAGAILLDTREFRGALNAFQSALACDPEDSLALYGLGLAQMACGDGPKALESFQRAERSGGDRSRLWVARRYAQWLDGAQISVSGAGLPDGFLAAQRALEGMSAARTGDWKRAVVMLEAAQSAIPGDAVKQPAGLLMTFDPKRPLDTAGRPLPSGHGLGKPSPKEKFVSGDALFAPEDVPNGIGYVSYEVDGQAVGLVNTPPYQLGWNSRQVANGWHMLEVVFYTQAGEEIIRAKRRLRVFNPGQSAFSETPERLETLRSALWETLRLQPDRFATAYAQGSLHKALGELPAARRWFSRAAALRPDSKEARSHLAATGGLTPGAEAVWGGLPTEKIIALTFDDGPKPGLTESLLTILGQYRVPSTFFVIGRHVTAYPELARQIVAAGMELANHSYTHPNLTKLSETEIASEFMQTQAAIQIATGKTPRFVRPPGGNWNNTVAKIARQWGLTPCFWTVDVYGSEVLGAQQVADAILTQVQPGSIILMHNGKTSTLQALPTVLRELRARGYTFVTVETLVKRLYAAKAADRAAAQLKAQRPGRVE